MGGYSGGEEEKARRLVREGIEVRDGRVDLEEFAFDRFTSDRPLEKLAKYQNGIAKKVCLRR